MAKTKAEKIAAIELQMTQLENQRKKLIQEKPETFDPKKLGVVGIEAVKELVKGRMKVCGCNGKAY